MAKAAKSSPPKSQPRSPKKNAAKKAVVVILSNAQQAKQDYPDAQFESAGRKEFTRLGKKPAGNLTKYEEYLFKTYFPAQEKRLTNKVPAPAAITRPDNESGGGGEGGGQDEAEEEEENEEAEEEDGDGATCISSQKDVRSALEDNADKDDESDTLGNDEEVDPPASQLRVGRAAPDKNGDAAHPAEKRKRSSEVSDKASTKKGRASKEPKVSTPARREVTDPEASDDEESGSRRRSKSTDSKLYKTYVQGRLLPAELRGWFLIAVLARDGPDHKSRSPNRKMNLYTITALLKNSVKVSDQVYKEFKTAVKECLEIPGERYYIFPHVLRTSVADLHVCRLHAYGFIDSFTNSLNPTIEGIQNKIKRWINAEVASSLGPTDAMKGKSQAPFTTRPGVRARVRVRKRPAGVLVRPAGGRVRAQAPFTTRPPGCYAHVRAPARRPYSRNPLAPSGRLIPAAAAAAANARAPCLLDAFGTFPDGSPKFKVMYIL